MLFLIRQGPPLARLLSLLEQKIEKASLQSTRDSSKLANQCQMYGILVFSCSCHHRNCRRDTGVRGQFQRILGDYTLLTNPRSSAKFWLLRLFCFLRPPFDWETILLGTLADSSSVEIVHVHTLLGSCDRKSTQSSSTVEGPSIEIQQWRHQPMITSCSSFLTTAFQN